MTENEARDRTKAIADSDAVERIEAFLAMVVKANTEQNLIAPSTVGMIWQRHALDSVQLLPLAPAGGLWIDIGTGGGFPGIVVGLARAAPMLLVEPRKRRADFLQTCIDRLGASNMRVSATKVQGITEQAAIISARAVASVENILRIAAGCSTSRTWWLLPRGHIDEAELVTLRRHWKGVFHVEQSLTDPQSSILVLNGKAS